MKKRRIRVVLKRKLETHPSLRYQWDPKQTDPMHPHHEVRAREVDTVRTLRWRVNLAIDELIKEGTLDQLNSFVYMLQGFEHQMLYGFKPPSLGVRPKTSKPTLPATRRGREK